jgi:hypothetical protein
MAFSKHIIDHTESLRMSSVACMSAAIKIATLMSVVTNLSYIA